MVAVLWWVRASERRWLPRLEMERCKEGERYIEGHAGGTVRAQLTSLPSLQMRQTECPLVGLSSSFPGRSEGSGRGQGQGRGQGSKTKLKKQQ